jgi:hypothetical protein
LPSVAVRSCSYSDLQAEIVHAKSCESFFGVAES